MKRKMVYAGIFYLVGLFFASRFDLTSGMVLSAFLMAFSALFCCFRKIKLKIFVFCTCFFLAGFGIYSGYEHFYADRIRTYEGCSIEFTGKITEMTNHSDDKSLYRLSGKTDSGIKADIVWYGQTHDCEYGDTVKLSCTVTGFSNTYLFKQKDHYESEGVYLQVSSAESAEFVKNDSFSMIRIIKRYRDRICRRITDILPGTPGALITAMLTGDKSGLDENESSAMYRTGIGHVMAVSGMHLVLLTSLISLLLRRAGAGRKLSFIVIEAAVIVFSVFTGMPVSVLRSAVMITLIYSSYLFARRSDPFSSLCISVIILTVCEPYLIRNASFLLSVSGTFGSAVFAPFVTERSDDDGFFRRLKKNVLYMFCVSSSVFPFSVMFFDETSVISPFTNIILIPVCEFMLICGFVCVLSGGASFLTYPALIAGGLAGKLLTAVSDITASLSFVSVPSGPQYISFLTAVLVIIVIITVLKFRDGKMTALSLAVSMAVMSISGMIYRRAESDVLNIYRLGTGKSMVYVVVNGHNADIADLSGDRKNVRYAVKALDRCGIKRISSLIFMKNPYQSLALFDQAMKYRKAGNVFVPDGTYLKPDTKLCGCIPKVYGSDGVYERYPGYDLEIKDKSTLEINYSGLSFECTRESIVLYSGNTEKRFEESDLLIRISGSGKISVTNLDENG